MRRPLVNTNANPALGCPFQCDLDQSRLALLRATPVVQRGDRDLVFLAILAPRHAAFTKILDDAADLLPASRSAILASGTRSINMDSSNPYVLAVRVFRKLQCPKWGVGFDSRPAHHFPSGLRVIAQELSEQCAHLFRLLLLHPMPRAIEKMESNHT